MESVKNFFGIKRNNKDLEQMQRIDGFLVIGYYLYCMILMYIFGLIMFKTDLYINFRPFMSEYLNKFIFYIPLTFFLVLPIFIIRYIRKQSFGSLGIRFNDVVKSILIGILFALPFILPFTINGIINGYRVKSVSDLFWSFLFYLIHIAFMEEIAYRGFILSRLKGLVDNRWCRIIIVGVMFAIEHIPFQMLKPDGLSINIVILFLMNIYLVYIYTRYDNLIAPVITHALIDFIPCIFIVL